MNTNVRFERAGTPITAAKVLYHLAGLEQRGIDFYQGLAQGAQSDKVRKLAETLARAEARHKARFLEYARRAEEAGNPAANTLAQPLPPEPARLLSAAVFVDKSTAQRAAAYATDLEAIKLAIRAEENIALLLTQLRSYVPRLQRRFIDAVIKQEWHHKARLEALMQRHFL